MAMEAELALGESALQSGHELAAKHPTQHFVGKKKRAASCDPARVIGGQTPPRGVRNGHGDEVGASDPKCAER